MKLSGGVEASVEASDPLPGGSLLGRRSHLQSGHEATRSDTKLEEVGL